MGGKTNLKTSLIMTIFLMAMACTAAGGTIYVDADASSANDGSSWEGAFATIQDGINAASHGDTVFVADGTYYENITLRNGVQVRGAGADVTTINGWRAGSVVTAIGVGPDTVLDGFTITNGSGTRDPLGRLSGGGIYLENGSPLITNNVVTQNVVEDPPGYRGGTGGGIYAYFSSATIAYNTINDNSAEDGGGILIDNWPSRTGPMANIEYNNIYGNSAFAGGGIYLQFSSATVKGNTIIANTADAGGGIAANASSSLIANNIIVSNSAGRYGGGGISVFNNSSPVVVNNTVVGNTASGNGAGIAAEIHQSPLNITNCIVWGNGLYNCTATYSDIEGGWPGIGNINADPLFVDPAIGDYHLLLGSPCIDTGNNSAVPSSVVTDLDGGPRIRGHAVDMGVYESTVVLFVDADAPGPTHNGSSWADAFNDLQDALADAIIGDEIRVAQGAYTPEGPLLDIHQASNPNPADGATSVSRTADLSWTAGSDATSHDVYFGTGSPGMFQGNQTATTFDPGTMLENTTYYWCVDELNAGGKTTTGTVWSFRTIGGWGGWGGDGVIEVPPPPLDRTATFQLKNGVVIKGGYAGFGEPNADARDIEAYETILSGDLLGNDEPNFVNYEENSYHVVTGSGCDETAVLDGFTITAGNANGTDWERHGGGMHNISGSPTLNSCTFTGNSAQNGGGMYGWESSPTLTKCMFIENTAEQGGGMFNQERSSPMLTNCTFSDNWAGDEGGGMTNFYYSSPKVTNCTFSGNRAEFVAGGMKNQEHANSIIENCTFRGNWAGYGGGGMTNFYHSRPIVTNCIFSGNSAEEEGGGMVNLQGCDPIITNCVLADNWAGFRGGGVYNFLYSRPALTNCILWGNTAPSGPQIHNYDGTSSATVSYSDVQGGWPGEDNIDADPCFVDSAIGDYHLLQTSACINAANNNSLPADTQDLDGDGNTTEPIPFDIEGNPRIVYDVVDMGPYEFYNTAPIADAGPDQIVECACNTEEGTKVTLDGTNSSDPDHGVLTYTWTGPFVESPAHGASPTVTLDGGCPGEYVISLVVNDGLDESEPNDVVITVVDTTPPEFEFSVTPTMLWPPDHKMVEITPSWTVSDKCDATPDVSLVSIVANEGDDTIGDGHTSNDIQIGEDGYIYLRSERSGTSDDRVYTIIYQAVDDYGNTTVRSATVSIPHDFKVLARIASRWLWSGPGRIPEDLNGDGVVNLKDIAIFANNWIQ